MTAHFSLALMAEALIRWNRPLLKGVGHFGAKYEVEGLHLPPTSIHR